jgi:hypothetical protein
LDIVITVTYHQDWQAQNHGGQIYPAPDGDLKHPTDSGKTWRGSHNTTSGRKMVKAIAAKKMM